MYFILSDLANWLKLLSMSDCMSDALGEGQKVRPFSKSSISAVVRL